MRKTQKTRCFTHVDRFLDGTGFIRIFEDGRSQIVNVDGTIPEQRVKWTLSECLFHVEAGVWEEIPDPPTKKERKAHVKKPKTAGEAKPLPKYPTINITQDFIDSLDAKDKKEMDDVIMARLNKDYPPFPGSENRFGVSLDTVYADITKGKGGFFKIRPHPPTTIQPFKARLYRDK